MKCIYRILLFAILLVIPTQLSAQLSGIKTIGPGGDYTTFAAAASDLNSVGVGGAVTFEVIPGTYTEQFELGSISGASASNTIVFQSQSGNAADVTVQFSQPSGANYIVRLNDADYVTFQNTSHPRAS